MNFSSSRRSIGVGRAVAIAWCCAVAGAVVDAASSRVKLATLVPKGSAAHVALQEMGEHWKNAPEGGIALTLFTDGSMGTEADVIRRMRSGQLQAGLFTTAGLAALAPELASLHEIPLMFRSLAEADWVREQFAPRFEETLAMQGFIVLAWCDSGWLRILSRKPVQRPGDLDGERINIGFDSPARAALARALGLEPVELLPPDLPEALRTGRVTLTPAPPAYALSAQLFATAPYLLELNWTPLMGAIVVARKSWDDLTLEQREFARRGAETACDTISVRTREEMNAAENAMRERGLKDQPIHAADESLWTAWSEKVRKAARGTVVPEGIHDELTALLAKHRSGVVEPTNVTPEPSP